MNTGTPKYARDSIEWIPIPIGSAATAAKKARHESTGNSDMKNTHANLRVETPNAASSTHRAAATTEWRIRALTGCATI